MPKRRRTTRTATLRGGPLDGTVVQLRIGDTTAAFLQDDGAREVYAGSPNAHNGAIELRHIGTVDGNGKAVEQDVEASS